VEQLGRAGPDPDDLLDDPVQEIAVMGDDHQRARVVLERLLELLAGGDVQVVRGLVQHEHVMSAVDETRQQQAVFLAAAEHLQRLEHVIVVEAEAGEERAQVALGRQRVQQLDLLDGRAGERLHLLVEVAHRDVAAPGEAPAGGGEPAEDRAEEGGLAGAVLADEADALAGEHRHLEREPDQRRAVADGQVVQHQDGLGAAAHA